MELEEHDPFQKKEYHLPNPFFLGFHINFSGVYRWCMLCCFFPAKVNKISMQSEHFKKHHQKKNRTEQLETVVVVFRSGVS